jgi:hypothetical protein
MIRDFPLLTSTDSSCLLHLVWRRTGCSVHFSPNNVDTKWVDKAYLTVVGRPSNALVHAHANRRGGDPCQHGFDCHTPVGYGGNSGEDFRRTTQVNCALAFQ